MTGVCGTITPVDGVLGTVIPRGYSIIVLSQKETSDKLPPTLPPESNHYETDVVLLTVEKSSSNFVVEEELVTEGRVEESSGKLLRGFWPEKIVQRSGEVV